MSMASLMMVGRLGPAGDGRGGDRQPGGDAPQVAFMGLSVGNLALVARATGSGQVGRQGRARQSLLLGGALSLLLVAVCLPIVPLILSIFGATPEVVANGTVYLRAIVLTLPCWAWACWRTGRCGGGRHPHPHVVHGSGEPGQRRGRLSPHLRRRSHSGPRSDRRALGLVAGRVLATSLSFLALATRRAGPWPGSWVALRCGAPIRRPAPPAGDRGPATWRADRFRWGCSSSRPW